MFLFAGYSLGNSSPLVIVDGVPGSPENLNVKHRISAATIKMQVLRLFIGVRGSNGVILIAQEKEKQETIITYDAYYGYEYPEKRKRI